LDVSITYGVEVKLVPTAIHVVSRGQAIADNRDPNGIDDVDVQVVKSSVLSVVAPPPLATPMASHVFGPAHEIPDKRFTGG
jgi:hypothetical protein